jgi:hypothetical protein
MTFPTQKKTFWRAIKVIWKDNYLLVAIAGWLFGLVTMPTLQRLGTDTTKLMHDLVPETIGILFTVLILERLAKGREAEQEAREIRQRIVREMASQDNPTARRAAREATERGLLANGSLRGAYLPEAHLEDVDLGGADLQEARLWRADLQRARLVRIDLQKASLERAKLGGSFLYRAQLQKTYLQEANLQGAELNEANLQGSNLKEANLCGADLQEANLAGTFLYRANLLDAQLEKVTFDENMVLPDAKIIERDEHIKPVYDKHWTPETDMQRYTNPNFRDFWQPDYLKANYKGHKPQWLREQEEAEN